MDVIEQAILRREFLETSFKNFRKKAKEILLEKGSHFPLVIFLCENKNTGEFTLAYIPQTGIFFENEDGPKLLSQAIQHLKIKLETEKNQVPIGLLLILQVGALKVKKVKEFKFPKDINFEDCEEGLLVELHSRFTINSHVQLFHKTIDEKVVFDEILDTQGGEFKHHGPLAEMFIERGFFNNN